MVSEELREEKEFFSFIREFGFLWGPSPEIYGGLAGFYTYGPLGKLLKNKVELCVRTMFNSEGFREVECPTILPDIVWNASGHLNTFSDRTIKCVKCGAKFRPDKLVEEFYNVSVDNFSDKKILKVFKDKDLKCPICKSDFESKIQKQSLMIKTNIAGHDASLRPETATGTYLPFLNYYSYFRKKLPFSVFQIGKVYRNEISPRQHILRLREFTQAEAQIFLDPKEKNNWPLFDKIKKEKLLFLEGNKLREDNFENFYKKRLVKSKAYAWCLYIAYNQFINFGIPKNKIRLRQHHIEERAFYAEDAWDIEVELNNYGWIEMCGVHDRSSYDLNQHSKFSKIKLEAKRENGEVYVPNILEIAFGIDRPVYALMDIFYKKRSEKEGKTSFEIPYKIAPIDLSIFPLMKKEELVNLAKKIKSELERDFVVEYDESGSIGRRYLRSSIKGTPYALTVDYDSLKNNDVTIRDRDSSKQVRIKIDDLREKIRKLLNYELKFEKI